MRVRSLSRPQHRGILSVSVIRASLEGGQIADFITFTMRLSHLAGSCAHWQWLYGAPRPSVILLHAPTNADQGEPPPSLTAINDN